MRGRTGHVHQDSISSRPDLVNPAVTTHEKWPFERLLAQRNVGGEDEYLIQWAPTWEKASSITDLRGAVRTLEETRAKLRSQSTQKGSWSHKRVGSDPEDSSDALDMVTASKAVADAVARWGKKVYVLTTSSSVARLTPRRCVRS